MVKRMVSFGAAALLLAVALLLRGAVGREPTEDPDAILRPPQTVFNPARAQEELQAQADESSFRFQMSARPAVTGREADLLLSNPVENHGPLVMTLTLDATGEELYMSESVAPGGQLLRGTLLADLPAGEHPATAALQPLDPETGQAVGAPLILSVTLAVSKPIPPP